MKAIERIHAARVESRRVEVLARSLARLAPRDARLLDVGCGDGRVAARLATLRDDLHSCGVDVLLRSDCVIEAARFDGLRLPFEDGAFDGVLLIDVLHHSSNARALLREAARVARSCVLLKDHTLEGPLAGLRLRFMDRVGNARHGVSLPYSYWRESEWRETLEDLGLRIEFWSNDLGLYPHAVRWLFESSLHFLARLDVSGAVA